MRIIAGTRRRRLIVAPAGEDVRPTSDRAREALMAILEHGQPPLAGARFLDLFAGSGAVGLEAASRGAGYVLLVERARPALQAIRHNLAALDFGDGVHVRETDVSRMGRAAAAFDIVYLDPPYGSGLAAAVLPGLLQGGWIATKGRVVIELAADERFDPPATLTLEGERRYGRGRFVFLQAA